VGDYYKRVVVITGVGSGIGRAMVEEFITRGTQVVALDVHLEKARQSVSGSTFSRHISPRS